MHIRTLGNTVQLCRWQVDYTMQNGDEATTPMTKYVPTEEEADALVKMYSGTKQKLDTAANEWIDGITVDSLAHGREIAAMGEQGYKRWLAEREAKKPEALLRENEQLKQQVTDAQLALAELYEMMTPGG